MTQLHPITIQSTGQESELDFIKKSHLHLPTALCKCAYPKVSLNEIQRAQQVSKESPLPRLMSLLTLKHAQNVRISSKPKSAASSPWTQVCCTTQILRFRLRFGFSKLTARQL